MIAIKLLSKTKGKVWKDFCSFLKIKSKSDAQPCLFP